MTPFADEVLALADGRRLAWAEWGDPRGSPLVFLHPCPGSRLLCPDHAATSAAGVRLITVDRPGYGRSDPVAEPTLAGFAHDLERLLDHLWVGQIGVVGWSCGGQYAVACAAVLAERVSDVALLATPAPDHELRWVPAPFRRVAELANHDPELALAVAHDVATGPGQSPTGWIASLDATMPVEPDARQALTAMWGEAFRVGTAGLAADMVAGCRDWGFAPSRIRVRTALFYGKDDPVIDPAHGRWWAEALPLAELSVQPGNGQSLPFVAWADILRAVAGPPTR
jgi:pimeloyl-ACP methyl ester carboxylesterase